MSPINDFINAGFVQMEQILSNPTFTWKGETFNCIPNTKTKTTNSVMVGFDKDGNFSMEVRLNQFTPGIHPKTNDYITYNGDSFQIFTVQEPPHGQSHIYICRFPTAMGGR